MDLTYLEGDGGLRQRGVPANARIAARPVPAGRKNPFSSPEDMSIFTLGDLESAPSSEIHLVKGPNIQGEMLRGFWKAAHAYNQRSDQFVDIRPFFRTRPFFDAASLAAELKCDSVEESNMGKQRRREAQQLRLDAGQVSSRGAGRKDEEAH